jgi:serine/threonine-protein kinase
MDDNRNFELVAIEEHFITEAQLNDAREAMRQLEGMGMEVPPLKEILIRKKILTPEKAAAIEEIIRGNAQLALPGYQIIAQLGENETGPIFKAYQPMMERTVAIRFLREELGKDPAAVKAFLAQARAMAKLHHNNIISGYDAAEFQGKYYVVMEYVDGLSVREILEAELSLSEAETFRIILQVADALEHASKFGIVHRDIKPENIIVDKVTGVPKITNFAFAKVEGVDSHKGCAVGTPFYMSPEQAKGLADVDFSSDVYSLGATAYHMLTGQVPFGGSDPDEIMIKHITEPVPDPQSVDAEITVDTAKIVMRMMAKEPGGRYPSPAELIEDVRNVLQALEEKPEEDEGAEEEIQAPEQAPPLSAEEMRAYAAPAAPQGVARPVRRGRRRRRRFGRARISFAAPAGGAAAMGAAFGAAMGPAGTAAAAGFAPPRATPIAEEPSVQRRPSPRPKPPSGRQSAAQTEVPKARPASGAYPAAAPPQAGPPTAKPVKIKKSFDIEERKSGSLVPIFIAAFVLVALVAAVIVFLPKKENQTGTGPISTATVGFETGPSGNTAPAVVDRESELDRQEAAKVETNLLAAYRQFAADKDADAYLKKLREIADGCRHKTGKNKTQEKLEEHSQREYSALKKEADPLYAKKEYKKALDKYGDFAKKFSKEKAGEDALSAKKRIMDDLKSQYAQFQKNAESFLKNDNFEKAREEYKKALPWGVDEFAKMVNEAVSRINETETTRAEEAVKEFDERYYDFANTMRAKLRTFEPEAALKLVKDKLAQEKSDALKARVKDLLDEAQDMLDAFNAVRAYIKGRIDQKVNFSERDNPASIIIGFVRKFDKDVMEIEVTNRRSPETLNFHFSQVRDREFMFWLTESLGKDAKSHRLAGLCYLFLFSDQKKALDEFTISKGMGDNSVDKYLAVLERYEFDRLYQDANIALSKDDALKAIEIFSELIENFSSSAFMGKKAEVINKKISDIITSTGFDRMLATNAVFKGKKLDVTYNFADSNQQFAFRSLDPSNLQKKFRVQDGAFVGEGGVGWSWLCEMADDYLIEFDATFESDNPQLYVALNSMGDRKTGRGYLVGLGHPSGGRATNVIMHWKSAQYKNLATAEEPALESGKQYKIQIIYADQTIQLKINGEDIGAAKDDDFKAGGIQMQIGATTKVKINNLHIFGRISAPWFKRTAVPKK